jgi:hypothetical protein
MHVDHTTIYRWVRHYAPELEKRCRPHLKATETAWNTLQEYEIMYMVRKGQMHGVEKGVLPLDMVDNSASSPIRLTIPIDPVYPSF